MTLHRRSVWLGRCGILLLAGSTLLGCTFFPRQGPSSLDIHSGATPLLASAPEGTLPALPLPYVIVQLNAEFLKGLAAVEVPEFARIARGAVPKRGPVEVRPAIGDLLSVTIFETGPGGLFAPDTARGLSSYELPPQTVDSNGEITVPYAGRIRAAGRTLVQIQRSIEEALKQKAVEPQVIVTIREQRASQVSVLGQVNSPGQFALAAPIRILDAIARAGGLRGAGHESIVVLQQGPSQSRFPFKQLLTHPAQNVNLAAGDIIYVERQPSMFVAYGSTGRNAHVEFDSELVTLMDGVGKAQGLLDNKSDPTAVFVFRLEPAELLARLGYEAPTIDGKYAAVIYTVDFNSASGFFLASGFKMRHRDVIYVSNAPSVEVLKFLELLKAATSPAADIAGIYNVARGAGTGTAVTTPIISNP